VAEALAYRGPSRRRPPWCCNGAEYQGQPVRQVVITGDANAVAAAEAAIKDMVERVCQAAWCLLRARGPAQACSPTVVASDARAAR